VLATCNATDGSRDGTWDGKRTREENR
jgi:hypothetical protein